MQQKKIDRINALSRKAKAQGLTEAEQRERDVLRAEYVAAVKASLTAQLDSTYVIDAEGNKRKLGKKD